MRNRARLGLRPGPGHATGFECWLRWGRLARVPPFPAGPPVAARLGEVLPDI